MSRTWKDSTIVHMPMIPAMSIVNTGVGLMSLKITLIGISIMILNMWRM